MHTSLDRLLAFHCGPTLTGLKAASLISITRAEHPCLREELRDYNRVFHTRGVYFQILCECGKNALLLVYDRALLERHLALPLVRELLRRDGYPADGSFADMLELLTERLRDSAEFPHEIGLFLGYPPEDVEGYIRHRGRAYRLCGYWKVYSDVDQAKALFQRYDRCRAVLCGRVARGQTISELFLTA